MALKLLQMLCIMRPFGFFLIGALRTAVDEKTDTWTVQEGPRIKDRNMRTSLRTQGSADDENDLSTSLISGNSIRGYS